MAEFTKLIELLFALASGQYIIAAAYFIIHFWYILKHRMYLTGMIFGTMIFTTMFLFTMTVDRYVFDHFYIWSMGFGVLFFNVGIFALYKQHFKIYQQN